MQNICKSLLIVKKNTCYTNIETTEPAAELGLCTSPVGSLILRYYLYIETCSLDELFTTLQLFVECSSFPEVSTFMHSYATQLFAYICFHNKQVKQV